MLPITHVHHVNLQTIVAGGESYTRSLTRALLDAGAGVTLYVLRSNRYWDTVEGVEVVRVAHEEALLERLPRSRARVVVQSAISPRCAERIASRHALIGVAHMPLYNRAPGWLTHCALIFTVSLHCLVLLRKAGMEQIYPEPMYGFPDPGRGDPGAPIVERSPYRWDRNKARDTLLGLLEPLTEGWRRRPAFERLPGLSLGVVSQIVPIKQFPLLLPYFMPFLARHRANLEIFGAGGFAQVRDLKRALAPVRGRVRFWGHQRNVAAIYPQLDYLVAGLPEREALGLNVLEAQVCGTPVLATKAPPFVETVVHEKSGFLYRDPREDGGRDLQALLESIAGGRPRPDPRAAREHLVRFSYPALVERTRRLLDYLQTRMPA